MSDVYSDIGNVLDREACTRAALSEKLRVLELGEKAVITREGANAMIVLLRCWS